jgi:hypothetical protein
VGSDGFRGVVGLKSDKERGVSWAGLQTDNDRESPLIRATSNFLTSIPYPARDLSEKFTLALAETEPAAQYIAKS